MKQETITIAKDILVTQMNHWIFFSIAIAISAMMEEEPQIVLWMFGGLLPIALFFIRRYTNGFWIIIGSHLLCLILLFLIPIPSITWTVIFRIYGILLVMSSFSIRLGTNHWLDEEIPPVVAVGMIVVFLFILHNEGYEQFDIYYIGIVAVYFICYYMKYYFQHYLRFLTVNTNSTGYIPKQEIFAFGTKLTTIFTLLGVPILLLISDLKWISWIIMWLKRGEEWLQNNIFYWINEIFLELEMTRSSNSPEEKIQDIVGKENESGWYWEILQKLAMVIVPIVFFCFLCYGVILGIRLIVERLNRRRDSIKKEEIKEGSKDIREKCEMKKKKETHSSFFAFLNPCERIRHIYKQKILENRHILVNTGDSKQLSYYTARECGNLLSERQLTQIYEKARYSGEKCTKEDVKKAAGKR